MSENNQVGGNFYNYFNSLNHICGFLSGHPWVQVDGVAPNKPLDSAVLTRLKQFSAMNKLKKMALRVSHVFTVSRVFSISI